MTTINKIKKAIKNPELAQHYLEMKIRKKLFSPLLYYLSSGGYSSPPYRIGIAVNSICNLRCVMCDVGQRQENRGFYKNLVVGGELSIEILKRLIDDIKKFRPWIAINSTEPLLYKNLNEFIDYIVGNGLMCSVTTNGLLLERFADSFVEKKLPLLYVSIDGPPQVHNRIRGIHNSFEKAYEGIQRIIDRKEELNEKLPKIQVAYTISNYNYHCLEETVDLFKELGVDAFSFTHLNFVDTFMAEAHNVEYEHTFGKVYPSSISAVDPKKVDVGVLTEQINIVKNKYSDFVTFIPDIATHQEVEVYYHSHEFIHNNRCTIPWKNAQILSNGDVIPASRCFHVIMGNIYKDSFNKIWNATLYQSFRKNLKKCGTTPACARCCGLFG